MGKFKGLRKRWRTAYMSQNAVSQEEADKSHSDEAGWPSTIYTESSREFSQSSTTIRLEMSTNVSELLDTTSLPMRSSATPQSESPIKSPPNALDQNLSPLMSMKLSALEQDLQEDLPALESQTNGAIDRHLRFDPSTTDGAKASG